MHTKTIIWIFLATFCLKAHSQVNSVTLKNFRVEKGQTSRVYFDSSIGLTGSSKSGFTISGKSVSGVHINSKKTSGHYFTVSSSFKFWDNNTIRYSGGSNLKDTNGNTLAPFTLRYIKNNISEPKTTGNTYYVSTKGNNSKNGLSRSNAWRTIAHAAKKAKPGDLVYIEAGDYGSENVEIANSGTTNSPIQFIGYKKEPGDNPKLSKRVGMSFSSNEMPLLKNGKGSAIDIHNHDYLIFKNIQIDNYTADAFGTNNMHYVWFDNVYLKNCQTGIKVIDNSSRNNRLTNSYLGDFGNAAVRFQNKANLVAGNLICSSKSVGMDYYIVIYGGPGGGDNIVINNTVERYGRDSHTGHGISMKVGTYGWDLKYNLIESNTVRGVKKSLEARHYGSDYNVFRNISIEKGGASKTNVGGIAIMNGASHNTFERINIENVGSAILVLSSTEDSKAPHAGKGNVIKNCVFHDVDIIVESKRDNSGKGRVFSENKIINCSINKSLTLFSSELGFKNNEFVNCIINNVTSQGNSKGFTYSYSNFYNNEKFSKPSGTGNTAYDPSFADPSRGNLKLKSSSKLIDKGVKSSKVNFDFEGNSRPHGGTHDMGAYEHLKESAPAPDTPEETEPSGQEGVFDFEICKGESITLVAPDGGDKYTWNNGETGQTITVSPKESTRIVARVTTNGVRVKYPYTIDVVSNCSGTPAEEEPDNDSGNGGSAGVFDFEICKGESVTLVAPDGGDKYTWNNGESGQTITLSPTETTRIVARVTTNGVRVKYPYTIEVVGNCSNNNQEANESQEECNVVANAGKNVTIGKGDRVTLTASGGDTYLWSTGETTQSIRVRPSSDTRYKVTVTANGCSDVDRVWVYVSSSATKNALVKQDLDQQDETGQILNVFPNPSTGTITVNYPGYTKQDLNLVLVSLNGIVVYESKISSNGNAFYKEIDLSRFKKGAYIVKVFNRDLHVVKKILHM